jgi:flagellar motor switch/type III secretory pathway protein FliN
MSVEAIPAAFHPSPAMLLGPDDGAPGALPGDDAWALYGGLTFDAIVTVPLQEMSLRDLARVQPGTTFRSSTFANEGAALSAADVFLANVSLEAAEDKLGFRINNFAPLRPRPAARGGISGLREEAAADSPAAGSLMVMRVALSLCFGVRRMQLREAVQLTSGDLISLDRGLQDLVTVMANGRPVASGKLVLIEGCYAVEVTEPEAQGVAHGAERDTAASAPSRVRLVPEPALPEAEFPG